jgi:hypothetical protein
MYLVLWCDVCYVVCIYFMYLVLWCDVCYVVCIDLMYLVLWCDVCYVVCIDCMYLVLWCDVRYVVCIKPMFGSTLPSLVCFIYVICVCCAWCCPPIYWLYELHGGCLIGSRKCLPFTNHYAQTNTNNGKKASAILQRTGGKDEPNIVSNVEIVTEIKTRKLERKDT